MNQAFRYRAIIWVFIIGTLILIGNLFEHQVLNESYRDQARSRTLYKRVISAPRGIVYDRNKELLVVNTPNYELEMIYREVSKDMDVDHFCSLLDLSREEYDILLENAKSRKYYRSYIPITFLSNIDPADFSKFQEHLFHFPGFYPKLKSKRNYPYPHAAHVLGMVSEVNSKDIEEREDVFSIGDIKGATGIEKVYEEELRGEKGYEYLLKDNVGREVEAFQYGDLDNSAESGKSITTTFDIDIQAYGESLMVNKRGSIVAIEPSSGEILAMISAPTYDPNVLSLGKGRSEAFLGLLQDTINEPLLNRTIQAKYPPGSIFKPILSLIAMQEGVWYAKKPMVCDGEYEVGNGFMQKCREHPSPYNTQAALQWSCNTYYYQMIRDYLNKYGYNNPGKGMDELMGYLDEFGIGRPLGVDQLNESGGFRPSAAFYDKRINTSTYSWRASYVLSLGIGQGELELTTLQMANLAAIIANRGYYYPPHVIKEFNEGNPINELYQEAKRVPIDEEHFEPVIQGMEQVISAGTGRAGGVPGIRVCGKTGTSQNSGVDHSVFFAFAPKDDPKIAIAVYVENAGGGGAVAAPIGGLIMEKYLKGSVSKRRQYLEKRVKEINLTDLP